MKPKATTAQVLAGVKRANVRITKVVASREALAKGTKRDATKILELATEGCRISLGKSGALFCEIRLIAKRMDARTGTSDPSAKKGRKK